MTSTHNRTYEFIRKYYLEHGSAPTHEVMGKALGYKSVHTTYKHVQALIEGGLLYRVNGRLYLHPVRTSELQAIIKAFKKTVLTSFHDDGTLDYEQMETRIVSYISNLKFSKNNS